MDLDYYLLRKRVYESEIYNNKNIVNLLEEKMYFFNESASDLNDNESTKIKIEISNLLIQQKNIKEQLNKCKNQIYMLCDHEFIKDDIEISPDNCECIEYCKICKHTN
jgi:hypothetical protein